MIGDFRYFVSSAVDVNLIRVWSFWYSLHAAAVPNFSGPEAEDYLCRPCGESEANA